MSKLETNTIDTVSGSTDLQLGSTNATIIKANDKILFNNSGDGIYLGVTSATASNLLDDYEEGTWTPTAVAGITGFSVSTQNTYTKVGRLVTVYCEITSFTGKSATALQIGGLPFTPDDNSRYLHGAIDSSGGGLGVSRTDSTSGNMTFYLGTTSRTNFTGNNLGSGARISLTYFAA